MIGPAAAGIFLRVSNKNTGHTIHSHPTVVRLKSDSSEPLSDIGL